MASPFYLFRKYQKAFLVVAGVLAMFIFVLADPLMSWLQSANGGGGGPRSAATVVASWDGGSLNLRQLDSLSQRRYRISQFLTQLVGQAAAVVEQEGGSPLAPTLPDFRLQQGADPRSIQVGCVTTRVLAELAEKSGITVSDAVINNYLKEWGLRRMGDAQIGTLLSRLGMSDQMLFAGLRELMLGNFYINSYSLATRGVMPEERWQDWKRINERIAIEAAVLPAEKFVADVPEPTESQLQEFHEQHREKIDGIPQFVMGRQLPSPDPGFREPRRVKLQYLVGSVDDWTVKLLDTVTDEEVADYYERNKRTQFVKMPVFSPAGLFDDAGEDAGEDTGEDTGEIEQNGLDETRPAATETETESPNPGSPNSESPAAESPAGNSSDAGEPRGDGPSGDEPAGDAPVGDAPAGDAPVGDEPAGEAPDEKEGSEAEPSGDEPTGDAPASDAPVGDAPADDAPAGDESGRLPLRSPFRLAALQTEAEGEPAAETAVENSATDTEPGDTSSTTSGDTATSGDTGGEVSAEEEKPLEYEPLENVRDQIRRSLARDKAVVELQKIVDRTYASLQSVYNPYGFEVVSARTEEIEIPAPPKTLSDYIAIATETGLTSEETVLLSQLALAETFVGKAMDAQSRREFVVQSMFGDQELYEPYRAIDLDGNAYIVCKTTDVPSSVPAFDAVREQVLTAWKSQQAAQLALDKAEDLAKQAAAGSDTVATVAGGAGFEAVTTDMFSWLSFGTTQADMQRGPRLGDAPPLEAIGVDFMTKAFKLKPDEAIALLNHDHSRAYVVQLDRREQTEAEMRQQFLAEANSWYGARVMNSARWGASQRQLLEQLSKQTGLNLDKLEEVLSRESQ